MRTMTKLAARKMRRQWPHLLGIGLLIVVGVAFFVTLTTLRLRYESAAEAYFRSQNSADVTLYGAFDARDVESLRAYPDVQSAHGRRVLDVHEGSVAMRAISLTQGIHTPSLYEGRLPAASDECAMLRRNARAMGVAIGDTIALGDRRLTVCGLVASPEYLYLVQSERNPMAAADRFAVVFVLPDALPGGFNEIVVRTVPGADTKALGEAVSAEHTVLFADQANVRLYHDDIEQIGTFAVIFPAVFAVLIAVVVYVLLRRMIAKERQQIGGMMALGAKVSSIAGVYLALCAGVAVPAALLGCALAIPICTFLTRVFGSMFEVPGLGFAFVPVLWIGAVAFPLALCLLSCLLSLRGVTALLPAQAMRAIAPHAERGVRLESLGAFWSRCSFHTRYALKSALRNKGRFAAVVLGMCGATALIVFSLGFYDSIGNTQSRYFHDFANYDVIANTAPMPLAMDSPAQPMAKETRKALTVPVTIDGTQLPLVVVPEDFDMVRLPTAALAEGVILSTYHARAWDVGIGDTLDIEGSAVRVSAIVEQNLGLCVYAGYEYLAEIGADIPAAYNTLYARGGDIDALTDWLRSNGVEYATLQDDRTSFASILSSMTTLIWLLLACALVLGFTVLYSVGMINLSAREHEYLFLSVMGFSRGRILGAHLKETALQLALSIPLGFAAGRALLEAIQGAFSGDNFVISSVIYWQSYGLAAALALSVAAVMAAVTAWHVGRLDIAQGMKLQEA